MNHQHQSFNQRQLFCEKNVERYGKGSDCNDQESSVPSLEDVARVVDDQQSLSLERDKVSGAGNINLPS